MTDGSPAANLGATDLALLEGLSHAGVGLLVLDASLRLVACNPRFAEINDLDPADLIPGWDYEVLVRRNAERGDYGPGDIKERVHERLEFTLKQVPFKVERIRSTGELLMITGVRLPTGGVVLTFDARGAADREDTTHFPISFDALRRAVEHSAQGIEIWDPGDRLLYFNPAMERIAREVGVPLRTGASYEENVRHRIEKGLLPRAKDDPEGYLADRLQRHRRGGDHYLVPMAGGRWLLVRDSPLPGGGIVTTVSDVSDLKRTEQALQESESRLRDFVRSSSDRFWELDADLRFTSLIDMRPGVGYPPANQFIGKTRWDRAGVDPETDEVWREHRDTMLRREEFRDFRYDVMNIDGEWRHWRVSGVPVFDDDGGFHGYRGVSSDETDYVESLRRAEAGMRKAVREAEKANRAKSMFLATVSHELRTPLNAIIGFSDLLVSEVFGPHTDPRYADYARDVQASGQVLLTLIEDMLDLTRAEVGQILLRESRVDLASEVGASIAVVRSRQQDGVATIETSIPNDIPPIWADARLIRQVLTNLISNAVKFTSPDGSVAINVALTERGAEVRIHDTGIGIDAQHLEKILRPFEQVDSQLSRRYEGIGLGLPLTKSFIELHGGDLEITSEPGQGTTVTVVLPRSRVGTAGVSETVANGHESRDRLAPVGGARER